MSIVTMECPGCGRELIETSGQGWEVTDGDPLGCGCDGCWRVDAETTAYPLHDDRCLRCAEDEIEDLRAELARVRAAEDQRDQLQAKIAGLRDQSSLSSVDAYLADCGRGDLREAFARIRSTGMDGRLVTSELCYLIGRVDLLEDTLDRVRRALGAEDETEDLRAELRELKRQYNA